jgi:uncharacterized membrane protein YedE/YeeE
MRHLSFLLAGVLFAAGLIIGGMTQPSKIIAFLDVAGDWDPSLAFVMLGAVGVHFVTYRLIMRRSAPIYSPKFLVPQRRDLTRSLIVGSAVFGIGWGLGGYCPGPGLVASGAGLGHALVFVGGVLLGHWLYSGYAQLLERLRSKPSSAAGSSTQRA